MGDDEEIRVLIAGLVAGVAPHDAREAADQAGILAWVASGDPLFRTGPPDTPPKHLVSYVVPVDQAGDVLLGAHRKSGLWLPPGGHCEDGEDPRVTVTREAREELGIEAGFHPLAGDRPFFLTVTPTVGENNHLDVSLWFLIAVSQRERLTPDPREFSDTRWFRLAEEAEELAGEKDWPPDTYDPEMSRFAAKLSRSA